MNKKLPVIKIKQALKKRGIEPDIFDVYSYVDSTLSLNENWNNIKQDLQFIVPKVRTNRTKSINKTNNFLKAQNIFNNFSKRKKLMDSNKQARTTFEMSDLNNKNFKKWKKHPNKYDVMGVDSKY